MAVSDQPISIAYATDGISAAYPFPYYFSAFADLVVTFKNAAGAVVTKILSTDYTVSGVLDAKLNVYSAGGTVTFGAPLAAGGQVRITRRTPKTQPVVYNPSDPFPAGSHERALDRAVLILQEALKSIGCLGIADGPPTSGVFANGDWYKNANCVPGGTVAWIWCSDNAWHEWGGIST